MTLIHSFWKRALDPQSNTSPAFLLRHPYSTEPRKLTVTWLYAGFAVATMMAFLRKRGINRGDRVAILGWNSPEWVWADFAVQSIGAVTVPIYPNSSAGQVNFVLKNSGALLTFSNETAQLDKVQVGDKVHFDAIVPELEPGLAPRPFLDYILPASPNAWRFSEKFALAEMEALKADIGSKMFAGVDSDNDLATIVYTSGSSGAPKGCMLSPGNIESALTALSQIELRLDPNKDVYLSYLPIAHVLERVNGIGLCTWNGIPAAFSTIEEMRASTGFFKPSVMSAVPAVLEKIYNGVFNPAKIEGGSLKENLPYLLNKLGLWKALLNHAIETDPASQAGKRFDRLIFQEVRRKLGGRLRLLVSGGAPIKPNVLKFFKRLGIEMLEGYGATETCSGITTNRPHWASLAGPKNKVGTVGLILPGCKVRIVAEPGEEEMGVGEIQLNGKQIFKGYWDLPEETRAAFTADGWFRSGDLGKLDGDNFLTITGRLNGMYKTSGGKYVPREKLEAALKAFPIVQYSVPVAQGRRYPVVLIWPDLAYAATLVGSEVPAGKNAAAWYAGQPQVVKAVQEAVTGANKTLEHWERMQYFRIMQVAATMENGIITETMKIRSKVLIKRFEKEIEELYANADRGGAKASARWIARVRNWLAAHVPSCLKKTN